MNIPDCTYRCKQCKAYIIDHTSGPIQYYKINDVRFGPYCPNCVEKGIRI